MLPAGGKAPSHDHKQPSYHTLLLILAGFQRILKQKTFFISFIPSYFVLVIL